MPSHTLFFPKYYGLILGLIIAAPVTATQVDGQTIAYACSGCHGSEGQGHYDGMPRLAGQTAAKLAKTLLDFKYQRQPSSVMGRISKGYTDAELQAVADYFSAVKGGSHAQP